MPATTMFSKFKSGNTAPQNPIDNNPITQYFEIGKQSACAGPELAWKIHDGYRKTDGKVSFMMVMQINKVSFLNAQAIFDRYTFLTIKLPISSKD